MFAKINHRGESKTVPAAEFQATCDDMVARLGAWEPGSSSVEMLPELPKANSTWAEQVTDEAARERIERTHDKLRAAGVNVNTAEQLYATGTRMADTGYATQERRKAAFADGMTVADAAERLCDIIRAEKRHELTVTAGDIGSRLAFEKGKGLHFEGYRLREQAIRGLCARMESPVLTYVLGLRARIADAVSACKKPDATTELRAKLTEQARKDTAELVDALRHECMTFGDVKVKLRVRDAAGDCFAALGPDYGIADAPSVLPQIVGQFPSDARGEFTYDPATTAWELKGSVFTPTPVQEQAVGEPFTGYSSFQSRDNGTRRIDGGGGIELLRCLNATVYVVKTASASRMHRKNVLVNIEQLAEKALRAINIICEAWGTARADVITQPVNDSGELLPLEQVIPGFYRHMLSAHRGELVGVLPGRKADHVEQLARRFTEERRDDKRIVRADLANGWTRYIQDMPCPVRRDAEQAVARWTVKQEPVSYLAA
jgi:hypothetical protein